MMHFDFQVGDLDSAVAEAVALGATVAGNQPQQNVRVLLDPAGHPSVSAETRARERRHPLVRSHTEGSSHVHPAK